MKDFIEQKFKEELKSIPVAVNQTTNTICCNLTTLTMQQQAIKEELTTFLKDDILNLLSKKAEDMAEEFKTSIDGLDKIIKNWHDMFKIDLHHINESLHNNTHIITQEFQQLGSSLSTLSLTAPSTLTSSSSIHESRILPYLPQLAQHICDTGFCGYKFLPTLLHGIFPYFE